jgi:secreted trypsin-like serine protease
VDDAASPIVGGVVEAPGSAIARRTVMFTTASGDGTHGCTATVLDDSHALTAAHCLIGASDVPDLVIVFANRFSASATTRPVTATHAYAEGIEHDIAVVTFAGGLPGGYVPVKLPDHLELAPGAAVIEAGYGKASGDSDGSDRGILRSVQSALQSVDTAQHRLLIGTDGHTVCNGDSGGPDFVTVGGELVQIGVHSTGDCATGGTSTDVRAYVDWIRTQLASS